MVRKLFKHELQYYVRSLAPMYIVLAVVALLGRFVLFFEEETVVYDILHGSSVFMFTVSCIAAVFLSTLFCLVRFYKNLFSGEGYLTMTLPATPTQHLFTKLAGGFLAIAATFVALVLALCLFTVGPWLVELFKAAVYICKELSKALKGHFGWYALEVIFALSVATVTGLLILYACICVGQLAKKNRVIAAVGAYFALYVIEQIISTVVIVILSVTELADKFILWLTKLEDAQVLRLFHGIIWIGIAWYAIVGVVFFLVSKGIMTRKLNLE